MRAIGEFTHSSIYDDIVLKRLARYIPEAMEKETGCKIEKIEFRTQISEYQYGNQILCKMLVSHGEKKPIIEVAIDPPLMGNSIDIAGLTQEAVKRAKYALDKIKGDSSNERPSPRSEL